MTEANVRCRRKSEKPSRCCEKIVGDLPHAARVQKWCVYEAVVVVCYHGNIEKEGRVESSLKRDPIDFMS